MEYTFRYNLSDAEKSLLHDLLVYNLGKDENASTCNHLYLLSKLKQDMPVASESEQMVLQGITELCIVRENKKPHYYSLEEDERLKCVLYFHENSVINSLKEKIKETQA